jgi:nitrite reductase/ring-hydroxylating ferredoxin subunit/uncharacterized membrane protein
MTLKTLESVTEYLAGDTSDDGQLSTLSEELRERVTGLFANGGESAKQAEDFLHGTWFGHPLHPALILVPAGAWTTAAVLDLLGLEEGADASIGLGLLGVPLAAAAGVTDWGYTRGKARNLGLVHALLNVAASGLYLGSWAARRNGNRGLGIGLSTLGLGVVSFSAYLGGEISYRLGFPVNRTAWGPGEFEPPDGVGQWRPVADAAVLVEGQLQSGELEADGQKIPLVLLKRGGEVYALHNTCAHLGGPLAEGTLVDETCVECPWHGSRFDMRDGNVVRGPSAYPQPSFETRVRGGKVEARLVR